MTINPHSKTCCHAESPFTRKAGGKTILAFLKPTALLAMFNVPPLEGVAQDVDESIIKITKEAATG